MITKNTNRMTDGAVVNVLDFGAVGDGVTDDTAAIQAAVDVGGGLYWPAGTYLTTASISNLHTVKHSGEGAIKRGTDTWVVTPVRSTLRKLYISPTGNATNDGLSSNEPISTIQGAVDTISLNGTVVGRQQVIGAAGTYVGVVVIPEGLAVEDNYLEFKFPSDPTVRGDPSSWPVGGAIFDGTGYDGSTGWTVGAFNRVYIEYLLFKDWYDTGLGATSQVVSGLVCYEFTKVFLYGCSGTGNGYTNVTGIQNSDLTITGGIFDGARYCINNTGGNMSLSASASTKTTIKNGLEYGIYCKHESSTVMDYTEFLDNGNVAGAENYGAAIFCFKTNASVDTRSCDFQRNNHVYNLRGGFLSTHPSLLDTFGAGVDGNTRIWKINGYGSDDLINYRSLAGRDLVWNNGPASTSSITTADILSTGVTIPAGYFTSADQYLEIDIWGVNNSASAAELRPTFRSTEPSNYGLGVFSINALSSFRVKLIVYPTAGATQFIQYDNVNTSVPIGNTTGAVKFDEFDETLYIRGSVPSSSLEVDKVRCVLWG